MGTEKVFGEDFITSQIKRFHHWFLAKKRADSFFCTLYVLFNSIRWYAAKRCEMGFNGLWFNQDRFRPLDQ